MALQNRKPFHFLCICWIILSYLGIIIIKAKQNCKYCIWHFNNQGYNVLVTRKRKTEYNPFKFPFITLPSSDLYILSHPSIHKNPLPGGFLCLEGRESISSWESQFKCRHLRNNVFCAVFGALRVLRYVLYAFFFSCQTKFLTFALI